MGSSIWWCKNLVLVFLSIFFLLFGIETLMGAFYLDNPMEFIPLFFAASLIILISVVGIIYPAFQFHSFFNMKRQDKA
jgi:hypothetical protein